MKVILKGTKEVKNRINNIDLRQYYDKRGDIIQSVKKILTLKHF